MSIPASACAIYTQCARSAHAVQELGLGLMQAAADFASAGTAKVHTNPGNIDGGVDIDVFAMLVGARAKFDGRP